MGAIQPCTQGSTKKGSTIQIKETIKYPNPKKNVNSKIFLGSAFTRISQNQAINEPMLKYHKAHGALPSAKKVPRTKEIIFDLFGSFNSIWQS